MVTMNLLAFMELMSAYCVELAEFDAGPALSQHTTCMYGELTYIIILCKS